MNLRGIFGSAARQMTPFMGDADAPAMSPAPSQMASAAAPAARQPFMTPTRRENWAAKAFDVGAIMRGQEPTRMAALEAQREAQAKEAEDRQRMEQMRSVAAELFPDNPRAQLLFTLDPKAFGGVLAEGLKPQTREGGKIYFDPMTGRREGEVRIDQFGDRYGFVNPDTLESGFGDPRGPTFSEETARAAQQVQERLGMGNLGVAQGNLDLRRREFERGPAAGGGSSGGATGQPWKKYTPGGSQ